MTGIQKPPSMVLHDLITGSWISQTIYTAAKLGIADLLADGPKHVDTLAQSTQTHSPSLFRVLRALASLGIFTEIDSKVFANTGHSNYLQSNIPGSMRAVALLNGEAFGWKPWGEVLYSVQTGQCAFEHVFGQGFFDYVAQHTKASEIFNQAMTGHATQMHTALVAAYDFSKIKTIVDVGGGHGTLLAAILKANPHLHGILFDLPHVVQDSQGILESAGVADRCEIVGGSFFEFAPPGDAYILSTVIHDWDDDRSLAILKNCRKSIVGHGTLLLAEMVIPPGNEAFYGKLLDLQMLIMTPGGRERTQEEYQTLFAAAGFDLTRIVPTHSPVSVIEGVPA